MGKARVMRSRVHKSAADVPDKKKEESYDVEDLEKIALNPEQTEHLSKKEKRDLKREALIAKLESIKAEKLAAEKSKKAKANPVTDLSSLNLALTSFEKEGETTANKQTKAQQQATKKVTSRKGRQYAMLAEARQFQAVLGHPAFKAQPLQTIHNHVANSLAAQK
eukprot:Colp12_sorted_trinity150504_noHs@32077